MTKTVTQIVAAVVMILVVIYLALSGPAIPCPPLGVDPNDITEAMQELTDELCGLQYDIYRQQNQQDAILNETNKNETLQAH